MDKLVYINKTALACVQTGAAVAQNAKREFEEVLIAILGAMGIEGEVTNLDLSTGGVTVRMPESDEEKKDE